ncbi:hypothetical protein [Sphingomonas ginkgonis]|uniref:hypothetical protein n=1 Tax=Sphingomonas ginkgonis TaxID=2315330 RepID=UPI001639E7DF|nr:hypothetical protein [Sphingomonas ginkgonis]
MWSDLPSSPESVRAVAAATSVTLEQQRLIDAIVASSGPGSPLIEALLGRPERPIAA